MDEWRKKDAEKNYKGQDFAMKLSQDHQGLSQDDLHPKPKRKRGRGRESEDDEYAPPRLKSNTMDTVMIELDEG